MSVVIRLARFGAIHQPKYRVTVADSRYCREGRFIEVIGQYNPRPRGKDIEVKINMEKAKAWIKKGAKPTDRVAKLLKMMEAQPV